MTCECGGRHNKSLTNEFSIRKVKLEFREVHYFIENYSAEGVSWSDSFGDIALYVPCKPFTVHTYLAKTSKVHKKDSFAFLFKPIIQNLSVAKFFLCIIINIEPKNRVIECLLGSVRSCRHRRLYSVALREDFSAHVTAGA